MRLDGLNPAVFQKKNADLKGQVQFLQNRLNKGKGGDPPQLIYTDRILRRIFLWDFR